MKTRIHIALAIAIAAITMSFAQANTAAPDAAGPKLSVTLGRQQSIALKADANGRLQARTKGDTAAATITARLRQTTATPFPVKGDPTRPYLTVTNGFEKPVRFRVFAREKGSRKFVEVRDIEPVEPGEGHIVRCFESGSRIEEITLSAFSLGK